MILTSAIIIWLIIPVGVIIYLLFEAFARKEYPTGMGLDEIAPTVTLTGKIGLVTRDIVPGEYGQNSGQIRIGMKLHRAISEEKIEKGSRVLVVKAEGITLSVEEISENLEK